MVQSNKSNFAVIVLAAGEGERMKSPLSKVLHEIAGKSMIARTLEVLTEVNPKQIIVVANPKNITQIKKIVSLQMTVALQKIPQGTADATRIGLSHIRQDVSTVAVMYGDDSAFYKPETILKVFRQHQKAKAKVTFVTLIKENPTGFGRIIRKNGKPVAIIEEKDASKTQKSIKEINDGLYFFERNWLNHNLPRLKPSRVTGELYITDLIVTSQKTNDMIQTYKLKDLSQWHGIDTQEELKRANAKFQKKIHIMGIAGAGAAAVAGIAQAYGFAVSGCDLNPTSPYTKAITQIKISKGHDPFHIEDVGMLVISPAVLKWDPQNKEVLEAKKLAIPVYNWQTFQSKFLQKDKYVIAIAGTYGKSTTTAMISKILEEAGLDPTCEIGATVLDWQKNFRVGKSKYYICEADEYNDNFLNYQSDIAVVLNLGWDHPDYFKTKKQVLGSYQKFVNKIKKNGILIIPNTWNFTQLTKSIRKDINVIKISDFGKFDLAIIGDFRAENANAALTIAKVLGLNLAGAKKSIENFKGIGRRLEFKGEINGIKVYDDYAVQPYTILKTADALKEKFIDKKVILVLEPHTFSRIRTFFDDYVSTLKNTKVDRVLITDVYAARERGNVTSSAIKLAKSVGAKAKYTGSLEQTVNYLRSNLKDFDVILSMGAGDIYKLFDLLKSSL